MADTKTDLWDAEGFFSYLWLTPAQWAGVAAGCVIFLLVVGVAREGDPQNIGTVSNIDPNRNHVIEVGRSAKVAVSNSNWSRPYCNTRPGTHSFQYSGLQRDAVYFVVKADQSVRFIQYYRNRWQWFDSDQEIDITLDTHCESLSIGRQSNVPDHFLTISLSKL